MNAYEKARDANIQRNAARLRSLGIPTVPPVDHSTRSTRAGEFRAKAAKRRRAAGKDARPLQVRPSHCILPTTRSSRGREASCLVEGSRMCTLREARQPCLRVARVFVIQVVSLQVGGWVLLRSR